MLVRELIWRLTEMPPDLPVGIKLWDRAGAPIEAVQKSELLFGLTCEIVVHQDILQGLLNDYLYEVTEPDD